MQRSVATSSFFDTQIALLNATGRASTAIVRFQKTDGTELAQTVNLDAIDRTTIDPEALGLANAEQIGTPTENINAVHLAHTHAYTSVMSHRSGETEDTTIAVRAVALSTGQIKTGSASRSDRIAKYNQLLRIEETLGGGAIYPGRSFRYV